MFNNKRQSVYYRLGSRFQASQASKLRPSRVTGIDTTTLNPISSAQSSSALYLHTKE